MKNVGEAFTRAELKRQQIEERKKESLAFAFYTFIAIAFLLVCWIPGLFL